MSNDNGQIRSQGSEYRSGVILLLACQFIWGVCPIYWQMLVPIESWVIILYRIMTMFFFSYAAARFRYSREEVWGPLRERAVRRRYFTAGFILTLNWSIYIWAMTTERVIQSSIGYYIEPIVLCAMGIFIFKEKLTRYKVIAMVFAVIAIIVILLHYRQIPGVALGLAGTWGIYSAIKKTADKPPLLSLVYETVLYAFIALFIIIYIECKGIGGMSYGAPFEYGMMYLSGLVTLIPVALYASAAKKVPMFVVGVAQYISPTITLLIGIFMFKEPIDKVQVAAFVIVWIGLVFFTYGEFVGSRKTGGTE